MRGSRWLVAWCLMAMLPVVVAASPAAQPPGIAPPPPVDAVASPQTPLRVVTVNVGNVSPFCAEQNGNLCLAPVERRVAAGIAAIDPDLIALIEVLAPDQCGGLLALNPFNSCALGRGQPQVMRLLAHDDYDVVCSDRHAWDCLGVRSSLGGIEDCDGGYCGEAAPALAAPEGCWGGQQSFLVDVEVRGVPLTVGVTHPSAVDVECRVRELQDLFDATSDRADTLLLGDFNFDPYRATDDPSVEVWEASVGEGRPFRLLSGLAEHDPPYHTRFAFDTAALDPTGLLPNFDFGSAGATIDHVVATSGVAGRCSTLGVAPGTRRLEGPEGGLDHRALSCDLYPQGQLRERMTRK